MRIGDIKRLCKGSLLPLHGFIDYQRKGNGGFLGVLLGFSRDSGTLIICSKNLWEHAGFLVIAVSNILMGTCLFAYTAQLGSMAQIDVYTSFYV